jgi:hypothetical protein
MPVPLQDEALHILINILQVVPLYPGRQEQLYLFISLLHVPFLHGFDKQLLIRVSQNLPVYPAVQLHIYEPGLFSHVP